MKVIVNDSASKIMDTFDISIVDHIRTLQIPEDTSCLSDESDWRRELMHLNTLYKEHLGSLPESGRILCVSIVDFKNHRFEDHLYNADDVFIIFR